MIPTATYRIQFRNGMTFDRAAELVPYIKRLGASHLYASPIFTATSGSTHGYDVTDANEIDPTIGGREGFDRMAKALKDNGLGLILDIVPNHMAASLENPWWRDVVENGKQSRYARYFDINWDRKLTLPFLGDDLETVVEAGDITINADPETGNPAFAYYDTFYPLVPLSYDGRERELLALTDKADILALHEEQPYRLMSWRDAPKDLSYRRFFEITGLVGVRVEDTDVFDDTHRLILDLVRDGTVDGLRVDHVDGLADPKGYLERLRQEAGADCYITVEKILGEGEHLPAEWPVSGTTGYEFIAALSDILVDNDGLKQLREGYQKLTGQPDDMESELRKAKLLMADNNFEGEVSTLLRLAMAIQDAEGEGASLSEEDVKSALRELLVAFPVYRTYGTIDGMPSDSRERLAHIVETVRSGPLAPDEQALSFIAGILSSEGPAAKAEQAGEFRVRFQQLTGPLMAKSVEDTLFFRHHAALALNEVGSEPLPRVHDVTRFHAEMKTRLEREPDALSGTSTHDTKRGEDARARLYVLSEAPGLWADAVNRWREINRANIKTLDDGPAPEPEVEWMLYQALVGVWPTDLRPDDSEGLKALEERLVAYVEKSLREAKLRSNWSAVNEAYEEAVLDYARKLLDPGNEKFLIDFTDVLKPFLRAGLVNSVTQTIVKLAAPGVPDIYQGSEGLDFSLVDPDNRREPQFETLQRLLSEKAVLASTQEDEWQSGRLKQHVASELMHLRRDMPDLFRKGRYLPLDVAGKREKNILAFARVEGDEALLVIVPRLVFDALYTGPDEIRQDPWAETEVVLPPELSSLSYKDICTGKVFDPKERLSVNWAFSDHPFALLRAQ
jgi:(1->4)-alpha-D-glucan 1-alpha-D-glucosylmutase